MASQSRRGGTEGGAWGRWRGGRFSRPPGPPTTSELLRAAATQRASLNDHRVRVSGQGQGHGHSQGQGHGQARGRAQGQGGVRHPSFRQSRSHTPQRRVSLRLAERTKAVVLRAGSQNFLSILFFVVSKAWGGRLEAALRWGVRYLLLRRLGGPG